MWCGAVRADPGVELRLFAGSAVPRCRLPAHLPTPNQCRPPRPCTTTTPLHHHAACLQLARGVICSSAGNHAQGVALAARHLGCSAVIVMPVTTPDIKVTAVRALGGDVELVGESYQEAQAHAQVGGWVGGGVVWCVCGEYLCVGWVMHWYLF